MISARLTMTDFVETQNTHTKMNAEQTNDFAVKVIAILTGAALLAFTVFVTFFWSGNIN